MLRHRSPAPLSVVVGLLGAALLTGCTNASDPTKQSDPTEQSDLTPAAESASVLQAHGLDGSDTRALIEQLDATPVDQRSSDFMAQVRPDTLVISDASGAETSLALPDEEFYVSIAPFVEETHECFFHSLTTCKGELGNEEINVQVIDDSGKTLVDESVQTYDNGFVGLWLPRDINGTITIEHQGRSVTDSISTGQDDPTCITTLQLT